ncbi:hypothetical protein [Saccharopolyspora sp. NPDC049426]|uniref:hypothetical protein n=1 Tax=Saccharopolyspora sp. NPDC049426 TaxID=3155652 RepID=UPI003449A942
MGPVLALVVTPVAALVVLAVVLTAVVLLVPVLLGRLRLVVARVRTRTPVAPVVCRTGLVSPVALPVSAPARVRALVRGRVPVAALVAAVVLVRAVAWGPARVPVVALAGPAWAPVVVPAWVVSAVELPGPAVLEPPVAAVVPVLVRARVRAAGVRKARTTSSTRLPTT